MMKLYWKREFILIGLLGFFSGLPLALTASTLTAWLSDAHVERAAIGLFAAIATPYALKFLWAPLLDGIHLPFFYRRLGRRRSWLLITQSLLAASLALMATVDPATGAATTALAGVLVATLSATQDTVVDAYRVERLKAEDQGTGAAWATFGYRIGMLVSGAGALYLADHHGWQTTYTIMAAIMATGLIVTLAMKEAFTETVKPGKPSPIRFLREYVVAPFRDFMTRPMWLPVLLFVMFYKLSDAFMGPMFNPFLLDIGFSKTEIAEIVKIYGLAATIMGTFAGGWLLSRIGMFQALMVCGLLHMVTNFMLTTQAQLGAALDFLTLTITLENFTGGMSTAAFVAYLSVLCKRNYTATQYALLSSLAAVGRTVLATPSGAVAANIGWVNFFLIASFMAVPGLLLLWWIERRKAVTYLATPSTSTVYKPH